MFGAWRSTCQQAVNSGQIRFIGQDDLRWRGRNPKTTAVPAAFGRVAERFSGR